MNQYLHRLVKGAFRLYSLKNAVEIIKDFAHFTNFNTPRTLCHHHRPAVVHGHGHQLPARAVLPISTKECLNHLVLAVGLTPPGLGQLLLHHWLHQGEMEEGEEAIVLVEEIGVGVQIVRAELHHEVGVGDVARPRADPEREVQPGAGLGVQLQKLFEVQR